MNKVILSITTIKSRIKNLKKILKSVLTKTQPDIIHIFFSTEPNHIDHGCSYEDFKDISEECDRKYPNVKIFFSEVENIGSYRKLIPALKLYKNSIIITIDDDELFTTDLIGTFLDAYEKHKCIICSVGRIVDLENCINMNENISYYKQIIKSDKPYMNILPDGYGGILYHSDMFDDDFINFDYKNLDEDVAKNDDIFFRNYTFDKGIKVFVSLIVQQSMNEQMDLTLMTINKFKIIGQLFKKIKSEFLYQCEKINYDFKQDLYELLNLTLIPQNILLYKKPVCIGTDVKQFQYENIYHEIGNQININKIIQERFFNDKTSYNTILINIEKDLNRYNVAVDEFKKINVTNFIHLKATYWKEKEKFKHDMNYILAFLRKFNQNIPDKYIEMNMFSELYDKNIHIQDGPLACYCSHVRSLIYGYLNFENYTIIVEDDFDIQSTSEIEKYIKLVPDDWSIITCGAQPINVFYDEPVYKFRNLFHSTQFYIVKNSCMEYIFANIYPIYDQIDILLSKLHNTLNIYNIANVVKQKNFSSNTQNNLHVIYNSPNYQYIRNCISNIKNILYEIIKNKLSISDDYASNITIKILFDVILNNISKLTETAIVETQTDINMDEIYDYYFVNTEKEKLFKEVYIIMNSCLKGVNCSTLSKQLVNDIYSILDGFELKNTIDVNFGEELIPFNYGSTSNIYVMDKNDSKIIFKKYLTNFRWKIENHSEKSKILNKEIEIMSLLSGNINFQKILLHNENGIYLEYVGNSLFDNFYLPIDWKEQLENLFEIMTKYNILYKEFNIKNITVNNGKIYIIDYGLAEISNCENNTQQLKNFIYYLSLLEEKFKTITNVELQHVYYANFINNIKLSCDNPDETNIY